jgi:co-chaperonin GroES (HSP10)
MLHSIKHGQRSLIVVGDRVLIKPDHPNEQTELGLYLPQTVVEKEKVMSGRVVAVGPGIPLPDPSEGDEEPWKMQEDRKIRFIPMQTVEGDYAVFMKKYAVEIKFEGDVYMVAPQSAILLLLRELE